MIHAVLQDKSKLLRENFFVLFKGKEIELFCITDSFCFS